LVKSVCRLILGWRFGVFSFSAALQTWKDSVRRVAIKRQRESGTVGGILSRRGPRTDYSESLMLKDLPFDRMAERLRRMLRLIGTFEDERL